MSGMPGENSPKETTSKFQEEWRPVVGWEGLYEVSSHGRVRSLDRYVRTSAGDTRRYKGHDLKAAPAANGYPVVTLGKPGLRQAVSVHRVVLLAFKGPPPPGKNFGLHADDNRENNVLDNLRWGDQRDNMSDMRSNGNNYYLNRTHCPQGHEYSEENIWRSRTGGRSCRACLKARRDLRNEAKNREKEKAIEYF